MESKNDGNAPLPTSHSRQSVPQPDFGPTEVTNVGPSVAADQADPTRGALYKGMEARQDSEYERLRMQHELHKTAMEGKLVRVPLSKDESVRILDSATGDGLWMVDVSATYPNAQFVGTDILQKHFEQLQNIPASITFKIQSVMDEWPTADKDAYDLVHQRYCLAMFSPVKGEGIVKRLFELVKPGGYIQLVDANLVGYDGGEEHPGMTRLMQFIKRAFTEAGMNPAPGPSLAAWLGKAGATDIEETVFSFPMGRLAATPQAQKSTTANLQAMIDNFAMIGSSELRPRATWHSTQQIQCRRPQTETPGYWYSPTDFHTLKQAVVKEMAETGNTWRFLVVTGRRKSM